MHVINSSRDRHLIERFNLISEATDFVRGWAYQWLIAPVTKMHREIKGKRDLQQLDDRMLQDIGLKRFDIVDQEENPSSLFKYPSW